MSPRACSGPWLEARMLLQALPSLASPSRDRSIDGAATEPDNVCGGPRLDARTTVGNGSADEETAPPQPREAGSPEPHEDEVGATLKEPVPATCTLPAAREASPSAPGAAPPPRATQRACSAFSMESDGSYALNAAAMAEGTRMASP